MEGERIDVDLTRQEGQYFVSDPVEVNGIPFKVRLTSNYRSVSISPVCKGVDKLFGKLKVSIQSGFDVETIVSKGDFVLNADGEGWRPVQFRKRPVKDYVSNNSIMFFVDFKPDEKRASPVVQSVVAVRSFQVSDTAGRRKITAPVTKRMSRKEFGYVGLRNISANCYLNSVIQAMFNIPAFRRLIYGIDAAGRMPVTQNVLLNLQILFYNMQTSPTSCSVQALMTSFGWRGEERCIQNDATEMWTVLVGNLRDKMQAEQKVRFDELFMSKIRKTHMNAIIGYQSSRDEEVSVLSLPIENAGSVQAALNMYCQDDVVDDYNLEGHGKVNLVIRTEFASYPEILAIQLNRWVIDFASGQSTKISKEVEFGEYLELPTINGPVNYALHAVFVHEGQCCGGGHYYAYVKPTYDDQWFVFNDENVNFATIDEIRRRALNNGYFFVWARTDTEEQDFIAVSNDEIPQPVEDLAKVTELSTMELTIVRDDCILMNSTHASTSYRFGESESQIEVGSSEKVDSLYVRIGEALNLQPNRFRLWRCTFNGQPIAMLKKSSELPAIKLIGDTRMVFLETLETQYDENVDDLVFLFIKYFDAVRRVVELKHSLLAQGHLTIAELLETMRLVPPHSGQSGYHAFLEGQGNDATEITMDSKVQALKNGSMIVYQPVADRFEIPESETCLEYYNLHPEQNDGLYPTFLEYKHRSVRGHYGVFADPNVGPVCFPTRLTMGELKPLLAEQLGIQWTPSVDSILLFYANDGYYQLASRKNDDRQPMGPCDEYTIVLKYCDDISEPRQADLRTILIDVSEDSVSVDRIECVSMPATTTVDAALATLDGLEGHRRVSIVRYGRIESIVEDGNRKLGEIDGNLRVDMLRQDPSNPIVPIYVEKPKGELCRSFFLELQSETFKETKARIISMSELQDPASMSFMVIRRDKPVGQVSETIKLLDLSDIIRIDVVKYTKVQYRTGSVRIHN